MQLVYTADNPLKRTEPNLGGRPRKLIPDMETLNKVRGLASLFCTLDDAAQFLDVTEKTFIDFINTFTAAKEAWEKGKGEGKISLRRTQAALAKDNVAMAIFLGKNYLGQSDKKEYEHRHSVKPMDPDADQSAAAAAYAEILNLPPSLRLIAPPREFDLEATDVTEVIPEAEMSDKPEEGTAERADEEAIHGMAGGPASDVTD